ncbi:histidine protein methyltransferase 1 homolog isoform X2 [Ooceraea biroi]|uniref:histidine protein methyltransferase 1 homolog isoform X2 n=1 Tax=Ooceraea biroi TaxID=2015173 RepID=UPI0005BB1665|nr:histidine protein methyltransferase 1 homolog isoform X2 [Ooceraea biroi]
MFKFGFAKDSADVDRDGEKKETLDWNLASKFQVTAEQLRTKYETDYYTETTAFPSFRLKLIRSDKVLEDLTKQNCQNIIEAESQHSDLVPAKYEGGLKVWECTYDLGRYIVQEGLELKDKLVMDLGCGVGLVGLIALLKGSTVHFQDYNAEVLRSVTVPNVLMNLDSASVSTRCEFYSGDWASLATLFDDNESGKYDYVFTSETIYNPNNHQKLYEVLKARLKMDGVVFVAGKTYYFGVGGGMRQFESLVLRDGCFDVKSVWRSQDGVNREILRLTSKTH